MYTEIVLVGRAKLLGCNRYDKILGGSDSSLKM